MVGVTQFVYEKGMVHTGKDGRSTPTDVGVDDICLVPRGDGFPQLLREAGQVSFTGTAGQEPVLGRR